MRVVSGVVHHYAWGHHEAIPRLLGVPPDGRPWAEAWFGTHHSGAGTLDDGSSLSSLTGELPYLLKLLAAAEPLSLQTHPDDATARAGFEREDAAGVPIDSPKRLYRDRSAKPEMVCAITPFSAVCGFRPVEATLDLLDRLGVGQLRDVVASAGLGAALEAIYRRPDLAEASVEAAVEAAGAGEVPEAEVVAALARRYPGDPSVAVALLLHHVTLQPGEALFLGAGNLHAYLHGVGVEVMGASDNVIRGGLTSKHVDVDELLRVVRPEPIDHPVVTAVEVSPGCFRYPSPAAPFAVRRLEVDGTAEVTADGFELVMCTAGTAGPLHAGMVAVLEPGETLRLSGSSTVFIVGAAGDYRSHR